MPWTTETKAGFGWATVITVVFIVSIWATATYHSIAPLVIPILAYVGFLGWVNRVK